MADDCPVATGEGGWSDNYRAPDPSAPENFSESDGGGNRRTGGSLAARLDVHVLRASTAPPHLLCVGAPACQWPLGVPEWRGVWLFLPPSHSHAEADRQPRRFDSLKWAERQKKYLLQSARKEQRRWSKSRNQSILSLSSDKYRKNQIEKY